MEYSTDAIGKLFFKQTRKMTLGFMNKPDVPVRVDHRTTKGVGKVPYFKKAPPWQ